MGWGRSVTGRGEEGHVLGPGGFGDSGSDCCCIPPSLLGLSSGREAALNCTQGLQWHWQDSAGLTASATDFCAVTTCDMACW